MYEITTLNWFLCQVLYRIGKKMLRQTYATNSEWRECFEKGKMLASHSDTMLEPIQTTGSPVITSYVPLLKCRETGTDIITAMTY